MMYIHDAHSHKSDTKSGTRPICLTGRCLDRANGLRGLTWLVQLVRLKIQSFVCDNLAMFRLTWRSSTPKRTSRSPQILVVLMNKWAERDSASAAARPYEPTDGSA
jgi:hypothetical protein